MEIYELELIKKTQEYKNIYTFSFLPNKKIAFRAGQWIHLGFLAENREESKVRHMSLASAPDDKYIEFSMDISSGSPYKNEMSQLKKGDTVMAFKIKGEFTVEPTAKEKIIFIAGGIGITPVRSILHDIKNRKKDIQWKLLHVSRDEFLYERELKDFDNQQWRVNRSGIEGIWDEIVQNHGSKKFYISGSDRFISGMAERLKTHNIITDQIVTENFDHQ